ncbi:MAG TPA: NYN domain-containing protein, partial [Candidatus Pacearchaeota archaeon]|nr:NYN domain-containing protein [Candidatus Pacearchaeota archaeon]
YDDNFRLQTAGVDRITIDDTGNVGIGTTAPSGLLHVAGGQCVTGDTRLRVKRRRKRQNERGEWIEEEYFEDCRIDQIKAGDEILTLDENTGRLAVSRVNALMDMGVKEIYRLTTATGKTIRTTANHPYLARIAESKKYDTIKDIPSGEGHLGPAHFGIAGAKGHFSNRSALQPIEGLVTAGSALHSALSALNLVNSRIAVFIDAANLEISVRKLGFRIHYKNLKRIIEQAGQLKYVGYFTVATSIKQNVELRNSLLRFGYKLVTKPLKLVKTAKGLKPKADVDVEITTEAMERKEDFDVMLLFSGDSDFYYPIKLLQEKYGKKVIVISTRYCISDELFKVANYYIDIRKLKNLIARGKVTKNPSFSTGESPCGDSSLATAISSLSGNLPFVKSDDRGRWTKVADLCEGMEIATADENSGRAVWERIAKIEKLPAEQVYDIEVEGTHNFVGNGIVAHNTYLQGADQLNTSFA